MTAGGKRLSRGKRLGGLILIVAVILASFLIGGVLAVWFLGEQPAGDAPPASAPPMIAYGIVMMVFGFCCLAVACCAYLVCWVTHCFTFDLSRPFFSAFKGKCYVLNILVTLPLVMAAGLTASGIATPILARAGLPFPIASMVPFFLCLLAVQLVLVWVNIWTPVWRAVVLRRLAAMGGGSEELSSAILAGISDPERSSMRKLTLVEDDVGALWIGPEQLVYRGDADGFTVSRDQLLALDQAADAGGIAAYAGAVHPVLRFHAPGGGERTVRLHAWGAWTLAGVARDLDALYQRLEAWRNG